MIVVRVFSLHLEAVFPLHCSHLLSPFLMSEQFFFSGSKLGGLLWWGGGERERRTCWLSWKVNAVEMEIKLQQNTIAVLSKSEKS